MTKIAQEKLDKCQEFLKVKIPEMVQPLRSDEVPVWGKMTPQHMIEHLAISVTGSTILSHKERKAPSEIQQGFLDSLVYSEDEMPRNVQNPMFKFGLPDYTYPDIETAKDKMLKSIDLFFRVYEKSPEAHNFNPFLGDLGFDELLVFHYKHFKHHFAQFRLL